MRRSSSRDLYRHQGRAHLAGVIHSGAWEAVDRRRERVLYRAWTGEKVAKNKRAGAIRIPSGLLPHLRRWAQQRRYLVEWRAKPANPKKAVSGAMDTVFGDDHGFVIHSFRHTCATWLMWSVGNVGDIAHFLSMSREILLRVYGHHHPDAHKLVGDLFMTKPQKLKRPA